MSLNFVVGEFETLMVSTSFSSLADTSSSLYCDVVQVEFTLQSASDVALLFIVLDMVELLADFSIPPDANDVFEDEMEIGNCCGRNDWIFIRFAQYPSILNQMQL